MRNNRLALAAAGITCLLFASAGCGEGDKIRTYEVPTASVSDAADPPVAAASAVDRSPARMLGAMIEQGNRTWFFKLMGPVDAVTGHEQEFHDFIESLTLGSGQPEWQVPAGWSAQGSSGMRAETFHVGDHQPPLELTVIPLPSSGILANVNRWRGQLDLQPLSSDQLDENIQRVKLGGEAGGGEAIVIDFTGQAAAANPMAGAPFAGGGTKTARPPASPAPSANTRGGSSELEYDVPEGWTEGQQTQFRKAAFHITAGDQQALVTVIPLSPSGTLANVNRWRGQIKLAPVTEEQMRQDLQPIEVDGIEGDYVEMFGEQEAILAAIILREGRAWFFKLQGDVELAKAERERFQAFLKSVEFK